MRISEKPKSIPDRALFNQKAKTTTSITTSGDTAQAITFEAGEVLVAFAPVYLSNGKLYNCGTAHSVQFITLTAAAIGDSVAVINEGIVQHGFTSVGDIWLNNATYSNTADVTVGRYLQKIGFQITTTKAFVIIQEAYLNV